MIEDDLRELIGSKLPGKAVYSRLIPLTLPECIVVQANAGTPTTASIRRAIHRITLMAVSEDAGSAAQILRMARDAVITGLPFDSASTHYYTATTLADGSLKRKALNGPRYIEYVEMEVLASL